MLMRRFHDLCARGFKAARRHYILECASLNQTARACVEDRLLSDAHADKRIQDKGKQNIRLLGLSWEPQYKERLLTYARRHPPPVRHV